MNKKAMQFLAYYLPQYHPIPENDEWWGKGFTEWTNVTKAKPLFRGHYQPQLPADLGFYDLRVPQIQELQSEMALKYGIDGFIYYQYWLGDGKMLLEKPAEAMLKNKNIKIPFCFCWANETWKGIWHGVDNPDVLIEQKYGEEEEYQAYFNYLLPFFKDGRYIKVENKPMFHIYKLDDIPNLNLFLDIFNKLSIEQGFDGIYFIATHGNSKAIMSNPFIYGQVGVDVFNSMRYEQSFKYRSKTFLGKIERKVFKKLNLSIVKRNPFVLDYKVAIEWLDAKIASSKYITCIFPNWDNSPRSGKKSMIFKNALPAYWEQYLGKTLEKIKTYPDNPPFLIIKSWNEWAEGNYLEPDKENGLQRLEAVNRVKQKMN